MGARTGLDAGPGEAASLVHAGGARLGARFCYPTSWRLALCTLAALGEQGPTLGLRILVTSGDEPTAPTGTISPKDRFCAVGAKSVRASVHIRAYI
jgi:hypothetical protein